MAKEKFYLGFADQWKMKSLGIKKGKAFSKWMHNMTPENKANLDKIEKERDDFIRKMIEEGNYF